MRATVELLAGGSMVAANLINEAYSERWSLPPLHIEGPGWDPVTEESLRESRAAGEPGTQEVFVVRDGERLLSLAWVRRGADPDLAELVYLATRREKRRQGLATDCLERAADWGRQQGCRALRLAETVDSRLAHLCRFLESRGFAQWNPEQGSLTMQLDLHEYAPREIALPPGFALTHFRPGDEAAWTELRNTCFEDTWPPEQFTERFGRRADFDPQAWKFVEHEGRKVALSGMLIARDPETGRITGGRLEWVGARPEYRGQGLGEAVVVACLNYAVPFDPHPVVLVTQFHRRAAIALYEKLGFTLAREMRLYQREL